MKHVIKLFASLTLVLFVVMTSNAQTATAEANNGETKNCNVKKCDPAMCDFMVKTGLCTKEQAAKCKAGGMANSTKVASASVERGQAVLVSNIKGTKKASCSKTCVKTCSSKSKLKSE